MTGPTVSYRTSFRRKPESRMTTPPSPPSAATATHAPAGSVTAATPIARLLALAHHVERLVEAGELKDYAEAGRRLGMCASHVTHIMALPQLAPDIQEAILLRRLATTERALRPVCRELTWTDQRCLISAAPD